MQLLIDAVFEVLKAHLAAFVYRLAEQFDIEEELRVLRQIVRHGEHVLHVRAEVFT